MWGEQRRFRYFFALMGILVEANRTAAYNARELSSRILPAPDHVIERGSPNVMPQGEKMDSQNLNRRSFAKLAAAALGGMLAGAEPWPR